MRWLRAGVAISLTLVYSAGYIRYVLNPSFHPPAEMTPIIIIVISALYGSELVRIARNGKKNGNGDGR